MSEATATAVQPKQGVSVVDRIYNFVNECLLWDNSLSAGEQSTLKKIRSDILADNPSLNPSESAPEDSE